MVMKASPLAIPDAESFQSHKRICLATRHVFVPRRFASHAAFMPILSCFRSASASCLSGFPAPSSSRFQRKATGLNLSAGREVISAFGSRNLTPSSLASGSGVRCLRAFPAAVSLLSSPNQPTWNQCPDRPSFPEGGRTFFFFRSIDTRGREHQAGKFKNTADLAAPRPALGKGQWRNPLCPLAQERLRSPRPRRAIPGQAAGFRILHAPRARAVPRPD